MKLLPKLLCFSCVCYAGVNGFESLEEYDAFDMMSADMAELTPSTAARDLKGMKVKAKSHGHYEEHVPVPQPAPMMVAMVQPMQVQQVEVQEFRRELGCPMGFDLVGNRCVHNELVHGDFMCPPGTQMVDGECAQFSRGRRDCPDGFRLSGSRCITTEIVPVEFTCPEGELDEAGTGCRTISMTGPICPPGFSQTPTGLCQQAFPAQVSCPGGHMMHKDKCLQDLGIEANAVCPPGSEMDTSGKKCFTMQPTKVKCPKGFKMSPDSSKCIKKLKKILAACPPGFNEFTHHKAICEKLVQMPPRLSCPTGSILDQVSGQCSIQTQGAASCPPGYQQCKEQSHLCERIVEEIAICPPGTSPLGYGKTLRCQTKLDHEIIECCPPGFEMSFGKCERIEMFAPTTGCQGDCSRVRVMKPTVECPDSYQLLGRRCVSQVSHACPAPLPIPTDCEIYANQQQQQNNNYGGASLRAAQAVEVDQIPSHCMQAMAPQPEICHSEDSVAPQIYCIEGDFDGTNCVIREQMHVEPTCRVGQMNVQTGKCMKTTSVPVKTECPSGTSRIGNRCVEYQDHAPEFSCPEGAISDRSNMCVSRVEALFVPSEVIRSPPVSMCSTGTLQGRMCYDVERIPRQIVCPGTSVPAGKLFNDLASGGHGHDKDMNKYCVEVSDLVAPPPHKRYVKPQFFCPDGEAAKGKHCHSHSIVEPTVVCPPGSSQKGKTCVREIAAMSGQGRVSSSIAVPICPPGTMIQGTRCVATREAQVMMSCPPGYSNQAGAIGDRECVRFVPSVSICPPGTRQTADGCIREQVVPPTATNVAVNPCEVNQSCS